METALEVLKKNYEKMVANHTDSGYQTWEQVISHANKDVLIVQLCAMVEYAQQACENQRELCLDAAEITVDNRPVCSVYEYWISKESILNAPLPKLL